MSTNCVTAKKDLSNASIGTIGDCEHSVRWKMSGGVGCLVHELSTKSSLQNEGYWMWKKKFLIFHSVPVFGGTFPIGSTK